MKNHIVGLAVFTFIVGAAAIVYAIFNVSETISVAEVVPVSAVTENNSSSKPTSCWNMKRKSDELNAAGLIIKQAVYNVKTKKFSWKLSVSNSELNTDDPTILHWYLPTTSAVMHLFLQDEKGIRRIYAPAIKESTGKETLGSLSVFDKAPSSNSPKANLYIMIANQRYPTSVDNPIEFDSSKAFPVTIDYGK